MKRVSKPATPHDLGMKDQEQYFHLLLNTSGVQKMRMKVAVSFSDLVHTGHTCNVIPYGIAMVASYALKEFGNKIKADIFKHPNDFIDYLENGLPTVACFSNYVWNSNLSYAFARQIKAKSPGSIIVFGGPNYPLATREQEEFLQAHPEIDFYIEREGEYAFAGLLKHLFENNFDAAKVKQSRLKIPNCSYMPERQIVSGTLMPRITDLDSIPSPYLSGLCDTFLKKDMVPLLETTRGCPFACSYCEVGHEYFSQIRRFSLERIRDEIEYIAQRTSTPTLQLTDSNFGMYKEDIDICKEIAAIQGKYNWPRYFSGIAGKNEKERILDAASIVKGSFVGAAVQSTDEKVLKNIKRNNVSISQMIQIAKGTETMGSSSFSEIILSLPGDTREGHFKSNFDLIDARIDVVRSHQFMMLPGSDAATKASRETYGMVTRFRVTPNTVGSYTVFGKTFFAPEIDEICVANKTLPFEDYLQCRMFNLTVEIFYNNGLFQELFKFLRSRDIRISSLIMNIHKRVRSAPGPLAEIYDGFLRETNEIWENQEGVESFLREPGVIDKYVAGELGNNEQLTYRTLAIMYHMEDLHTVAFEVAEQLLRLKVNLEARDVGYLKELAEFSCLRKKDILSVDKVSTRLFHYDFVKLLSSKFNDDPNKYYEPEGININVSYTHEQEELILQNLNIYGQSMNGIAYVLSTVLLGSKIYRVCTYGKR